ncbi:MAG: hypothetical protein ACRDRO_19105 [Pseudonocardiaceae bacterium]
MGSATANRTLVGIQDVVGFFVNGRFTQMRLEEKTTVAEAVRRTRDAPRLRTDVLHRCHRAKGTTPRTNFTWQSADG